MRAGQWLLVSCLAAGCGLDAIPGAPGDDGAGEGGSPDASSDVDPDHDSAAMGPDVTLPALPEAGMTPPGDAAPDGSALACKGRGATALYEGAGPVQLEGVTSDGYAVYAIANEGGADWSVYASPVDPNSSDASAPAIRIAGHFTANGGAVVATGASPTVLLWDGNPSSPDYPCNGGVNCRLRVWSSALGTALEVGDPVACLGAASADGSSFMYVGGLNTNSTIGSLIGASTDLSSTRTLAPLVALGSGSSPCGSVGILRTTCAPNFAFVGPGAGQRAIAAFCQPATEVSEIWSFPYPFTAGNQDAGVQLTNAGNPGWSTDSTGRHLFTVSGGDPVLIDTSSGVQTSFAGHPGASSGTVSPDGRVVYFVSPSRGELPCSDAGGVSALWKGSYDGGVASPPYACDVANVLAVGEGGGIVFFGTRVGEEGGTNLYSAAPRGNGTSGAIVTPLQTRAGTLLLGFTTDRTQLTWLGTPTGNPGLGGLVSGFLTSDALDGQAPYGVLPRATTYVAMAAGSKIVSLAGAVMQSSPQFNDLSGDLYVADLSNHAAAPQLLSQGAYYRFGIDPSGTRVAIACNPGSQLSGVYSLALP